jgi:hypothetical protein
MAQATALPPGPSSADRSSGTVVIVAGYFYRVEFVDSVGSGSGVTSYTHLVGKDRRCLCYQGASCPAVAVVAAYLKAGGARAPDPPTGYFPVAPAACPVCGAETIYDPHLSSKHRGAGWRCVNGGSLHYWEAHVRVLKMKAAESRDRILYWRRITADRFITLAGDGLKSPVGEVRPLRNLTEHRKDGRL